MYVGGESFTVLSRKRLVSSHSGAALSGREFVDKNGFILSVTKMFFADLYFGTAEKKCATL